MVDRLSELKASQTMSEYGTFEEIELKPMTLPDEIKIIKDNLSRIKGYLELIKAHFNKNTQQIHRLNNNDPVLEELCRENEKHMQIVRKSLQSLKEKCSVIDGGDPQKRTIYNFYLILTKKFMAIVKESHDIHKIYDENTKKILERRIKIINPKLNDNQIEEILQSGNPEFIFTNTILDLSKREHAMMDLALINEQNKDLEIMEKNINELHSLFLDVSSLLEFQGDTLIKIEESVSQSNYNSQKSLTLIGKSESLVRSRRKRCMVITSIIIGIVIVILIIILAPIAAGAF